MMKKIIFILAIVCTANLSIHAQKKVPKYEKGNALFGLKKALVKKYNYQSINIYILAGKLNIDIADIHVKALPKNIRETRSSEIAVFSRNFLNTTPNGIQMLKGISGIGINHLKNPAGGLFQPIGNIYDSYSF